MYILRLHELEVLAGTLTAEQVAVFGDLLHDSGVDSIALLEGLLGRRPLADQARDEGRGAGFLVRLADAVEGVSTGDGTDGHVQAALFSEAIVSCWFVGHGVFRTRSRGRAYAEALVHGLVGGVGAPAALGAQHLPRRRSGSSGGKHGVEGSNCGDR